MSPRIRAFDFTEFDKPRRILIRLCSQVCILACLLPCVYGDENIDYTNDVQPILSRNCVACHNGNLAEGGLNLENHAALSNGGDSGESFVPGQPDASYLLQRADGSEEPWMPPDDNAVGAKRLTPSELQIIEAWIRQGAETGSKPSPLTVDLQPLPAQIRPTYDLEFARDGSFLAYGFGSTAYVVPINPNDIGLTPNQVGIPLVADDQATTHLDIVQSIAVSPDCQRIATGGYKQVKLWRQTRSVKEYLRDLIPHGDRFALSPGRRHLAYQVGQQSFEVLNLERGVSRRYLKTHSEPLVALCWYDEEHVVSCDESGSCFRTGIDGQQQELGSELNSVERLLAADSSNDWLYAVYLDSSDQIHVVRRSIGSPQDQAGWAQVVDELLAPDTEAEAMSVAIAVGEQQQLAIALNRSVSILRGESWDAQTQFETASQVSTIGWNPESTLLALSYRDRPPEIRDGATGDMKFLLDQDYAASQRSAYLEDQFAILGVRRKKVEDMIAPAKELAEKEAEAVVKLTEERDKAIASRDSAATALAELQTQIRELETLLADPADHQAASEAEDESESDQEREQRQQELKKKKTLLDSRQTKLTKAESDLAERKQALASARDVADVAASRVPALEKELSRFTKEMTELDLEIASAKKHVDVGQDFLADEGPLPLSILFADTQIVVAQSDRLSFFSTVDGSANGTLVLKNERLTQLVRVPDAQAFIAYADSGRAFQVNFSSSWELERVWGSVQQNVFPDRITALDFSPDGRLLAIGSGLPSRGGDVYLVEPGDESSEFIHTWKDLHSDQVLALRFSSDGRYLASGAADKICHVLDVASSKSFRKLEGHGHHILGVGWRWDAQTLATASADGTTKVWSIDDATQLKTLSGLSGEITSVQYMGRTNTISAVSTASHVRTLDASTGKVLKNLGSSQQPLYAVTTVTSPPLIAAAGQMGSVWIWNAESGKLEVQIKNPTEVESIR